MDRVFLFHFIESWLARRFHRGSFWISSHKSIADNNTYPTPTLTQVVVCTAHTALGAPRTFLTDRSVLAVDDASMVCALCALPLSLILSVLCSYIALEWFPVLNFSRRHSFVSTSGCRFSSLFFSVPSVTHFISLFLSPIFSHTLTLAPTPTRTLLLTLVDTHGRQLWDCMLLAMLHRMPQLRRLYLFGDMRGGLTPVAPIGLRCVCVCVCECGLWRQLERDDESRENR